MRCEFDPASGSVMAKAIFDSPLAIDGSQRSFCSSVPNVAMSVAQIAGDTSISNIGHPAAATSSHTMVSSVIPIPPPP